MSNDPGMDHWKRFWLDYTKSLEGKDDQSQVLRTRNKAPIDPQRWAQTLEIVAQQLELADGDTLLDLCCGNGLFSAAFSPRVRSVDAVDLSPQLIDRLMARALPNVRGQARDIREAEFPAESFTKVLWYAGIQYLGEGDIVAMIRRIRQWMKPGGVLLIGDIPDRAKLWKYFDDPTRQQAYFDGLMQRKPIIGSWLETAWLEKLCVSSGFQSAQAMPQDAGLFYADFRFDLITRA